MDLRRDKAKTNKKDLLHHVPNVLLRASLLRQNSDKFGLFHIRTPAVLCETHTKDQVLSKFIRLCNFIKFISSSVSVGFEYLCIGKTIWPPFSPIQG